MPTKDNIRHFSHRTFGIVPAAGESRRMGEDKLLLPWDGGTVIGAVIRAWRSAGVENVVAVPHPANEALIAHLQTYDIDVVVPVHPPAEMKHTVQRALEHIDQTYAPHENDAWLLAPADMPTLSPEAIRAVIGTASDSSESVVPTHLGRQGHPVLLRWRLRDEVTRLTVGNGINTLLERDDVRRVECGPAAVANDVDTPDDYRKALAKLRGAP